VERVCFGYRVRSALPFAFTRGGSAPDELEVVESHEPDPGPEGEPLREWLPTAERPLHARLFQEDGRWRMWVAGLGSYRVDADAARIEVPSGAPTVAREERLWGIPSVLCFTARGDHSLHAASVEVGGRALVFGAPGRHGKTTTAAALVRAGGRLLAEDSTCIRISSEGAAVVPGPAMLRVRPDSHRAVEIPGTHELERTADRIHLALDDDRRGDGEPVALRDLFLLRPSEDAGIRLERVSAEDAIPDLWALSFSTPTDRDRARCFDRLAELVSSIRVWNLRRPLSYDALDDVVRAVEELPTG
jgi:hypothetical protein